MAGVLVYYIYSAARISFKFKDATAMRLIVLYFVRAFAWLAGAAVAAFNFLFNKRRKT